MFLVVMHHCVFASGVEGTYDFTNNFANSYILQCCGAWGKAAINAYVLITGFFMCKSNITIKKVLKLILEIKFYEISIFVVFAVLGLQSVSIIAIAKLLFSISININHSFVGTFVVFYLFIPFYNKLIVAMDKKEFLRLLFLLIGVFTCVGTFLSNFEVFTHLGWYTVLYFIAAYIRFYPSCWSENKRANMLVFFGSVLMTYLSIFALDYMKNKVGININPYYLVMNSHKLLALTASVSMFLWFKNLKLEHSNIINTIASATFGVLLIHTYSGKMSELLWNRLFDVCSIITQSPLYIVGYVFTASVSVFVICMLIDFARIVLIESRLLKICLPIAERGWGFLTRIENKIV